MVRKKCYVLSHLADRPFSSAVRAGDFIFICGLSGVMDAKGKPIEGDVRTQTRQCLENIGSALELANASFSDVVKVLVFLKRPEDFDEMNKVYKEFFPENRPARATVLPGLLRENMLIEVECIAYKP